MNRNIHRIIFMPSNDVITFSFWTINQSMHFLSRDTRYFGYPLQLLEDVSEFLQSISDFKLHSVR